MISGTGFFSHMIEGTISSAVVLAAPLLVLVLANRVFKVLAPADFNQVSIIRRAGVIGGTLLGAGIVLAAALASNGKDFTLLTDSSDNWVTIFIKLLGSQLVWFRPTKLVQAPAPAFWLVLAGFVIWLLPTASAAVYWHGRQRIGAFAIAVLIVPFMALSLVYAITMVIWFVHLLNIWSIAVAGLIYQRYRNSQLGHG
jgi:hypothetical protein